MRIISGDCRSAHEAWDQIGLSLSTRGQMYLITDFDGTLAEITAMPSAAAIDPRARTALMRLSAEKRVTVAVLSGRSVSDVADRVGLPVIYGGDHGLEIHGAEFDFVAPGAEAARLELPAICNEIRGRTAHIPGALVEVKRFTASVHYRQVKGELTSQLTEIVGSVVDTMRFELRHGHCVIEIRPRVNWGKGQAVRWLLDRAGAVEQQVVCIGDDETDEDMFNAVPGAVNVRVTSAGETNSAAQYWLERHDVPVFLEELRDLVQGFACASSAVVGAAWRGPHTACR